MTTPIYEVVAFRPSTQLPADTQGTIMQVAADRWLVLRQPAPSLSEADFAITDVTGKWREIRLVAPSKILANTVDVEELLAGRDCARTALFDCPAILQRLEEGYAVWIERSYEHAFHVAVQQAASL
jgi:hypothetical protein